MNDELKFEEAITPRIVKRAKPGELEHVITLLEDILDKNLVFGVVAKAVRQSVGKIYYFPDMKNGITLQGCSIDVDMSLQVVTGITLFQNLTGKKYDQYTYARISFDRNMREFLGTCSTEYRTGSEFIEWVTRDPSPSQYAFFQTMMLVRVLECFELLHMETSVYQIDNPEDGRPLTLVVIQTDSVADTTPTED